MVEPGLVSDNRRTLATWIPVCCWRCIGTVLAGFAPFGGDPELMYQPIKAELGRALTAGCLPFWSDRFGLGVPLVAESHVAAFYPPNWLFYRLWDYSTAYRLTMWLHWVALAGATYLYARVLEISHAGSALAAVSFSLCGFQAVHAPHEPFYHLMPYVPLCLYLADRYAVTGRLVFLAGLAIAWGVQLTLGHFQIQMWTGGLVLVAGSWRALKRPGLLAWNFGHILGLFVGLLWGATIAAVQLRLTWELTGVAGFIRPPEFLANFLFPPAHWAQFAATGGLSGPSLRARRHLLGKIWDGDRRGVCLCRCCPSNLGCYRLGGLTATSTASTMALDRIAFTGSSDHARVVARCLFLDLAASGPGLVSRTGAVYALDQSWASPAGRAGPRRRHYTAPILERPNNGCYGRYRSLGLVDLLGSADRLSDRDGGKYAPIAVHHGRSGMVHGAHGRHCVAAKVDWPLGTLHGGGTRADRPFLRWPSLMAMGDPSA